MYVDYGKVFVFSIEQTTAMIHVVQWQKIFSKASLLLARCEFFYLRQSCSHSPSVFFQCDANSSCVGEKIH